MDQKYVQQPICSNQTWVWYIAQVAESLPALELTGYRTSPYLGQYRKDHYHTSLLLAQ